MAFFANRDRSVRKDLNYTMGFEWYTDGGGVHWKKLTSLIPSLAEMGITALWIPPPTKAAGSLGSVGYDVYDVYDLGEFDQKNVGACRTKYGTKDELLELAKTAKEHDVVIYVDAVFNHKFGADDKERFKVREVDRNDRTRAISDPYDILGWTKFTFDARANKYSDFKWNFDHFTGVDYDAATGRNGVFKIEGNDWATRVGHEYGNYDYLMGADIDQRHQDVVADLYNWGVWIHSTLGDSAAGFRFDAIKHIDEDFITGFIKHVRQETGQPNLFAVGEFWSQSLEDICRYLDGFGTQFSVFDVPLHYKFFQAGQDGRNFDIRSIWDNTLVKARPIDAVTIVDNHDTQIGQSLQSWVSPGFKPLAYAMILLRGDGYPCVFWGDLYGCGGDNPQQPVSTLSTFIKSRNLFSYGETRDYWNHPNCVGWVRVGDDFHDGCAVVMSNGDEGWKDMEVGKEHAGEEWTDALGWYGGVVKIGENGWATFRCHAESVSIWVKVDARGRVGF